MSAAERPDRRWTAERGKASRAGKLVAFCNQSDIKGVTQATTHRKYAFSSSNAAHKGNPIHLQSFYADIYPSGWRQSMLLPARPGGTFPNDPIQCLSVLEAGTERKGTRPWWKLSFSGMNPTTFPTGTFTSIRSGNGLLRWFGQRPPQYGRLIPRSPSFWVVCRPATAIFYA